MTDTLFTIQEHNEYNAYDKLYPKTHASLIVNPPQATGARIDVTCSPASAGIVVNLSGQKTASATTDSNGKCSFESLDYGEYTISATIVGNEQSKTINIDASKIYDVELGISASATLNDNDWATISNVSSAGLASSYWSVGDCKAVTLNGTVGAYNFSNYTAYMFIIDFDHNSNKEMNGEHSILFSFGKSALTGGKDIAFVDSYYNEYTSGASFRMSSSNTNNGGWQNSYMRSTICPQFKNAMPSDLQVILRSRTIYTDNTGGGSDSSSYVTATTDTVYIPSEFEVQGSRSYANSAEQNYQQQLVYYKNGASKIRYKSNDTSAAVWWCRSPCCYNGFGFCHVNTDGVAGNGGAYRAYGFAPLITV